jgi:prophage regulatory protein
MEANMPESKETKRPRARRPRSPSGLAGARILREREVLDLLGIGRTTLWTWVRAGSFPAPIKLGPAAKGWTEATIKGFLESRPAASSR